MVRAATALTCVVIIHIRHAQIDGAVNVWQMAQRNVGSIDGDALAIPADQLHAAIWLSLEHSQLAGLHIQCQARALHVLTHPGGRLEVDIVPFLKHPDLWQVLAISHLCIAQRVTLLGYCQIVTGHDHVPPHDCLPVQQLRGRCLSIIPVQGLIQLLLDCGRYGGSEAVEQGIGCQLG